MAGENQNGAGAGGTGGGPNDTGNAGADETSLLGTPPANVDAQGKTSEDKGAAGKNASDQVADKKTDKPADAAGDKSKTGEQDKNAGSADLELKLPEGFVPDEAIFGKFKASAKELGLDSAKAQKLFDLYVEAQQDPINKTLQEFEQTRKGWVESLRKDPEIGGAKFDRTVASAQRAIQRFGSDKLREALISYGLDNHPELVRAFAKIGESISEDSVAGSRVSGGESKTAKNDDETFHRGLYPKMFEGR